MHREKAPPGHAAGCIRHQPVEWRRHHRGLEWSHEVVALDGVTTTVKVAHLRDHAMLIALAIQENTLVRCNEKLQEIL
jgi:hypothetical protein